MPVRRLDRWKDPEVADILDRILDKGLCLDGSALLAVGSLECSEPSDQLTVASVEIDTGSYAESAPQSRYVRFKKPQFKE